MPMTAESGVIVASTPLKSGARSLATAAVSCEVIAVCSTPKPKPPQPRKTINSGPVPA